MLHLFKLISRTNLNATKCDKEVFLRISKEYTFLFKMCSGMIDKRHIYVIDVTQSKTNHTCKNVHRNWTINWNLWLSHKLVKYPMTNLQRNWYVNWIKMNAIITVNSMFIIQEILLNTRRSIKKYDTKHIISTAYLVYVHAYIINL